MIVKIEVSNRRDLRFRKEVLITNIDKTIIYKGELTADMKKKLDGSSKSHFLASVEVDPNDNTKKKVILDTRVKPQGW